MKRIIFRLVLFLLCTANFIITLILLWNLMIFCDAHNYSPSVVCGSEFGLILLWLDVVCSFIVFILSIHIIIRRD